MPAYLAQQMDFSRIKKVLVLVLTIKKLKRSLSSLIVKHLIKNKQGKNNEIT